jgi:tetratricopeptide (TPR) repeat protein
MMGLRILLLGLLVLVAAAPMRAAQAQDDPRERRANSLFREGAYQQAREILQALYVDTGHPTYLRNVGRCYQEMGDAERAIEAFQQYLQVAPALPDDKRRDIEDRITRMEQLRREKQLAAAATTRPAVVLRAPPVLASRAPAADTAARPEAPPFFRRWWFWTAAAVATGVVAGTIYVATRPTPPSLGTVDLRGR